MSNSLRCSAGFPCCLLAFTLSASVPAKTCLETFAESTDATLACAELDYFVDTGEFVEFRDSVKGQFESRFDDFELFIPEEVPDSLRSPFLSDVQWESLNVLDLVLSFEIEHRGTVSMGARDSLTQGAIYSSEFRTTFTPRTTDNSSDLVLIELDLDFDFTLQDPAENATSGRAVGGGGVEISDQGSGSILFEIEGFSVLDLEVSPTPQLEGDFEMAGVFKPDEPGDVDSFDIFIDLDLKITVPPGEPITLESSNFGSVFTDGFEAGDTSAWSSTSLNTMSFSVSSPDPNVSFEIEAEELPLTINPGLNGSWFNPATNGQGFFLDVFPDIPLVFLAWFTFDTTQPAPAQFESMFREMSSSAQRGKSGGKPEAVVGDDNHRWLTAQGPFEGDTATLNVTLTTGGLFDDPTPVENTPEGTITLHFSDCSNGTVDYDFTAAGVSGSVPIVRLAPDNVKLCQSLSGQ